MSDDYARYPLVLPLDDDVDDWTSYPSLISLRVDFCERFRRQGKVLSALARSRWGKADYPMRLTLKDATSINRKVWWRDVEPIDLSMYAALGSSAVPHGYWKWRIYAEPDGIAGKLYDIWNPSAPGGASIMAEDFFTAAGVATNLPSPFSAPMAHWNRRAGLQYGYTTDAGVSVVWTDPVWN